MVWSWGRRSSGGTAVCLRVAIASAAAVCAIVLAGCNTQNQQTVSAAQPRGATVSFESIDGLPPEQFKQLVQNLNDEAQARRLAVMSRETQSAYRVRGYVAAEIEKSRTTISWVWDVFDRDGHRALRIDGAEIAKSRRDAGWEAADEALLRRVANSSMEKLAAFLTSPEVAPGIAPGMPERDNPENVRVAQARPGPSSPEAAGIFRIFQPRADPVALNEHDGTASPAAPADAAGPVPLPRRRPMPVAAVPTTLTAAR